MPEGLFDTRWLDEAMPDWPVMLRAGLPYGVVQLGGVAPLRFDADTPDLVLGEIVHREDASVLGTLREWGAVDLGLNASSSSVVSMILTVRRALSVPEPERRDLPVPSSSSGSDDSAR